MSNISIDSILDASNAVINDPSKSLKTLGVNTLIAQSPLLFAGMKIYQYLKKIKIEQTEKERLYKETIRKQQAAINKLQEINKALEKKLREADAKNGKNQMEISQLKKKIKNLEDIINLLGELSEQLGSVK